MSFRSRIRMKDPDGDWMEVAEVDFDSQMPERDDLITIDERDYRVVRFQHLLTDVPAWGLTKSRTVGEVALIVEPVGSLEATVEALRQVPPFEGSLRELIWYVSDQVETREPSFREYPPHVQVARVVGAIKTHANAAFPSDLVYELQNGFSAGQLEVPAKRYDITSADLPEIVDTAVASLRRPY